MVIDTKEDLADAVLRQLSKGKENAVSGKQLAQRLGERDTRYIRLAIIKLIESGKPICGISGTGYFIAETPEECQECLDRLMSYIKMLSNHHKYLLRASKNIIDPYQIKLL